MKLEPLSVDEIKIWLDGHRGETPEHQFILRALLTLADERAHRWRVDLRDVLAEWGWPKEDR